MGSAQAAALRGDAASRQRMPKTDITQMNIGFTSE
jgi:hypothetical protein